MLRQILLPISYKGHILANPLKVDLIVADLVIVECKATTQYNDIFESQLLTYLRLSERKLGLSSTLASGWSRTASTA